MSLDNLIGIGKVNKEKLIKAGIKKEDQLRKIGAEESFRLIKDKVDGEVCIMVLYALEGAIQGKKTRELSKFRKDELKKYFKSLNRKR